jgi:tetratricopeptide (TPR) repeat protein
VLLFEDLHWSDPTTLEVLDLMIDRVKTIPLLMVMTHRPEFRNRWVERGHVSALNLSKLTRAQSSAVVSRLAAGKALPEGLPERIIAKTDGVPLYVEELTRSILESGELIDTGDQYEYAGGSRSVNIPATLRDSLMARLDRVKPVKEIAQIGAVIGREFSYELISVAAQLSTSQLDDALVQLADSGLAFRRGTPPDAVYTFKHALVQDAAYDSLLKSRRQELHARIAGAIEKRFTHTKETEPEILAHHLTAAGETDSAIPLWQKAGEIALKRTALAEAISHLSRGLDLVKTSPASEKRDVSELLLRTSTGAAWQALQGWGATEVWNSLRPALDLAKSLSRHDELVPIYWGLVQNVMTHGHLAESLKWALEMLEEATTSGHSDLLVEGHMAVCTCNYWMGKLGESMEHADKVLTLYCEEQHSHLVKLVNNDARTAASGYASQATWRLGFPDRAVLLSDQAVEHARRLGHPFDLGHALTIGSDVFDLRCDADELRRRAEEAEQLGQENNLPLLYGYLAPCRLGISYIRKGDHAKGLAPLKAGLAAWEATGGKIRIPYLKAVLAEGMALVGEINDALHVIDEQIEQAERPGWEERSDYAEILRLKGWVLTLKKEFAGAENSFLASLDVAREQQAKSWELRTSTSLARLWQSQGKCEEALDLLAPVYDWFTEGFDTKDLKDAKALLGELSA